MVAQVVNFAAQALRGEPLTIYGDGSQTRSLCHVSDLIRGIVAVMEGEGLAGEVFNLGNPDERTMIDLAHAVMTACGTELPLVFHPDADRRSDAALPRHQQGATTPRLAVDDPPGSGA
jgi:nucleoside-diphosphate-sugar epimerase